MSSITHKFSRYVKCEFNRDFQIKSILFSFKMNSITHKSSRYVKCKLNSKFQVKSILFFKKNDFNYS